MNSANNVAITGHLIFVIVEPVLRKLLQRGNLFAIFQQVEGERIGIALACNCSVSRIKLSPIQLINLPRRLLLIFSHLAVLASTQCLFVEFRALIRVHYRPIIYIDAHLAQTQKLADLLTMNSCSLLEHEHARFDSDAFDIVESAEVGSVKIYKATMLGIFQRRTDSCSVFLG